MEAVLPGAMSGTGKVEAAFRRLRPSEGATVAAAFFTVTSPVFLKVSTKSNTSPGEMGLEMSERLMSTSGWAAAGFAFTGMVSRSVAVPEAGASSP